ncbi:MAG: 2-oxo acid dehydrogenase subunit E2 [Nocardioidaceae bacterium]
MEEIFVPALGMAMEEAVLSQWLKSPGEPITTGDVVAVVETDKSTYDLVSSTDGVLGAQRFGEGVSVPVGVTVTVVLESGESDTETETSAPAAPPPAPGAEATPESSPDPSQALTTAVDVDTAGAAPADVRAPHRLSPRRRRDAALAAEAGLAQGAVVTEAALRRPTPTSGGADDGSPATRGRSAIAAAVSQSWSTIPHFAVSRLVRADALRVAVSQASVPPARVTVTDALLRALALAVEELEPESAPVVAMSVATDRGVVNVSVPDLTELSLRRIARVRRDVVARARKGRLGPADGQPAAATLSNLGTHGVHWFTGIVPVGQSLLLTVGAIHETVISEDGQFVARPSFWATLNLDHRRYDGADGARLLDAFASVVGDTRVLIGT